MSQILNQNGVNQQQVDDNNPQDIDTNVVDANEGVSPYQAFGSRDDYNNAEEEFFKDMTDEDFDKAMEEMVSKPKRGRPKKVKEPIDDDKQTDNPVVNEPIDNQQVDNQPQPTNNDTQVNQPEPKQEEPNYKIKIRAVGKDFDFTIDELKTLASKGIDYTTKLQKISPYRKAISAMEENGITQEDIFQLIEMKKGNKDAIGAFTKKHNIALSDIEQGEQNASQYQPNSYGNEYSELNEIDRELSQSMEQPYYNKMVDFVNKLDKTSQDFFINNPEALRILADDVNTGMFDKIKTEMDKDYYLGNYDKSLPILQRYINTNNKLKATMQNNKASVDKVNNQNTNPQQVDKSKLGLTGTSNTSSNGNNNKVIDLIDENMSDEDFNRLYEEIFGEKF